MSIEYDDNAPSSSAWSCVVYHGYTADPAVYSVRTPSNIKAYGYSYNYTDTDCDPNPSAPRLWAKFYDGYGKRLITTNAATKGTATTGNKVDDTLFTYIEANYTTGTTLCSVERQCRYYSQTNNYRTFEVLFDIDAAVWRCRAYHGSTSNATEFSDAQDTYERAVGWYSLPYCGGDVSGAEIVYYEFYRGFGLSLNSTTPGNAGGASYPPRTEYYPVTTYAVTDSCLAQTNCARTTRTYTPPYQTYDLHYDTPNLRWVCTSYINITSDITYLQAGGDISAPSRFFSRNQASPVLDATSWGGNLEITCNSFWTLNARVAGSYRFNVVNPPNTNAATYPPRTFGPTSGYLTGSKEASQNCRALNYCRRQCESIGYHTVVSNRTRITPFTFLCTCYYGQFFDYTTPIGDQLGQDVYQPYYSQDKTLGGVDVWHADNIFDNAI